MVRDRVWAMLEGEAACRALERALQHVEVALLWLGKHNADQD
jgi:hypothetical protein